ncbi:MAG: aminodeoxychorismate/anthranilate synthase component II [Patescibacteria group bacterium]
MVLIIDNYDSFTYNLYQQIAGLGHSVEVVKHDATALEVIETMKPSHIVISPGPGRPDDSGISLDVIRHFYKTTPILGVCLGHQCIGEVFGSRTVAAPTIMHGKADLIHHSGTGLFAGVVDPLEVARYHSLVVYAVPEGFERTAWSNDGSIMGMQHDEYPLYGVQFHPESFMTNDGMTIMSNFLK